MIPCVDTQQFSTGVFFLNGIVKVDFIFESCDKCFNVTF